MKRCVKFIVLLLATTLLLSGCVMRTVEELYCLPERSQADDDLRSVIDSAMSGMSYCSPIYGDNRQPFRQIDLNGDGVNEYVICARDNSKQPLKLLIFSNKGNGYSLDSIIEGYGFAFDFVDFANLDDKPGMEILVGRQVGDGVVRSAAVYSFQKNVVTKLLETSYSKILTCDMDGQEPSELLVLHPSDVVDTSSQAELYRYVDGTLSACNYLELSNPAGIIRNIEPVILRNGAMATMVTAKEKTFLTIEIFSIDDSELEHIYGPIVVGKLHDSYLYPTDVDADGDIDLPELVDIKDANVLSAAENWIRWYEIDGAGERYDGMYTFHNYEDKWYLHMDRNWTTKLTVVRTDGVCTFKNTNNEMVLTIFALTGANRIEQVQQLGATVLGSSDTTTFAATLGAGAEELGITTQRLPQLFYPIEMDLNEKEG